MTPQDGPVSPEAAEWASQVEAQEAHAEAVRQAQLAGIASEVRKSERQGNLLDLALIAGTVVVLAAIVAGITAYVQWVS